MSSIRLRLGQLISGLSLAVASLAAQADFVGDITVQLLAPGGVIGDSTPIALSQTVALADLGTGVLAGQPGDISGYMVDGERIFFTGTMIMLRVGVGNADGGVYSTGYLGAGGEHARYQFDGVAFTGRVITNILVYAYDGFQTSGPASASGLLSPADPAVLVNRVGNTITFDLDTLVLKNRFAGQSNNYAEFRIDMITAAVPEPATWMLFACGLVPLLQRRGRAS